MKKITLILATMLLLGLTVQSGFSQDKDSEKNKKLFLQIANLLETQPFHKQAKDAREWGFKYLVDTKDVTVGMCGDTMKLNPDKKNKYKSELLMQLMFGMAKFKLENPDQKDDEDAAQVAGLESMLKSYEAMKAEKKKARNKKLDELVRKRDNGELIALVKKGDCDSK